jgi:endonuclease III
VSHIPLPQIIAHLHAQYGKPKPFKLANPWEMILWENVAYLADDVRRQEAFQVLKRQVGTRPEQILSASDDALLEVTRHGIMPEQFAEKLRKCARILLEQFDGDLGPVLELPLSRAKKALQKFPGIGEPGAEKILLVTRAHPVLALDSNGLRVLVRLGFAEEKKSYSATYQLIRKAVEEELDEDPRWLIEAHQLLRQHGQETCRRTNPDCDDCPLASDCAFCQTDKLK